METFDDIWNAVLDYCKSRVTETAFSLWIKMTEFSGYDPSKSTVTLTFPKQMYMDVFMSQYEVLVKKAFEEIMGFQVELEYICKEEDSQTERITYQDEQHLYDYKNEQFTFENFIVGKNNNFAYAAAKAIASDPGTNFSGGSSFRNYNPLFIYGNSGLGKTHLLNAICHEAEKNFSNMNVMYVRTEQFANEFIQALQLKRTDEFHEKYRNNIDILLMDDIQFIAGKEATEEEFFHTFDSLVYAGKQVVLTSDRPPKDIQSLMDRLKSRFEDGLLADIQPPEYETRCAIIKRKAMLLNFDISDPVVNYIAEKIKSNIRQLEGVTKKLYALCNISAGKPTIAMAQSIIKVIMEDTQPLPVTIQKVVDEVSRTTGVSSEEIYSKQQKANISHARKITFYIIRKVTSMSYEDIGSEFKKHHSTVMYNINQLEEEIERNPKLARQVNDIISNVKSEQ